MNKEEQAKEKSEKKEKEARDKAFQDKLKELRKRDPFTYKNF
jgi:hypothetical protein